VHVGPHADEQSATNARHDLEAKGFKSDDAHERRKIVNNRAKNAARIAVFGLLLGCFCTGCNKGVVVPSDCQRFLGQFFQALKSNDVGKLQELSFTETVMDLSGVPQQVADRMRDDQRQMDKTQLEKMKQMFGDFVKVNSVTAADLEAVKMQGAKDFLEGTHAVIICKAKFSKASGRFGFDLIKKSPESEYLYEAYRFEEQL
jgi:hypothetical protein